MCTGCDAYNPNNVLIAHPACFLSPQFAILNILISVFILCMYQFKIGICEVNIN
jgi:hypothetical protein